MYDGLQTMRGNSKIHAGIERELVREPEREIVQPARRPEAGLLADAAPAISVVVGIVAVLALGFPLIP